MAKWGDVIGALVVLSLFLGVIYAVLSSQKSMQTSANSKSEALRKDGVHVDSRGVRIKMKNEAPTQDAFVQQQSASWKKGGEKIARSGAVSVGNKSARQLDPSKPDWARQDAAPRHR